MAPTADRVTFILGAGSNAFANLPSGPELNRRILTRIGQPDAILQGLTLSRTIPQNLVDRFREFRQDADVQTIDEFMAEHANNPAFLEIGRHLVAYEIGLAEKSSTVLSGGSWYTTLRAIIRTHRDLISDTRLSFITFNYDRSLEHYLERQLRPWRVADEALNTFLGPQNFVHVHGSLGPVLAASSKQIPYGSVESVQAVGQAALHLRFPCEVMEGFQKEIDQILASTRYAIIMGFGFHPTNVQRLRKLLKAGPETRIYATIRDDVPVTRLSFLNDRQFKFRRSAECADCMTIAMRQIPGFDAREL